MTLKKHGDRYYLSALPIKSTENLVVKSDKLDDFTIDALHARARQQNLPHLLYCKGM